MGLLTRVISDAIAEGIKMRHAPKAGDAPAEGSRGGAARRVGAGAPGRRRPAAEDAKAATTKADEPKADEPKADDEPKGGEETKADEPKADEPKAEKPAAKKPAAKKPAAKKPAGEKAPADEKPAAKKPAAKKPAAEEARRQEDRREGVRIDMANYTVADIQTLRDRTGAGMLDVKKALDEADGDLDKAVEVLRVKGLKGVSKREGRSASEGLVAASIADGGAGQIGTLIEINSETDFVAKSHKFVALADGVLAAVVASGADSAEAALAADAGGKSVEELIDENAGVLGEKIVLRRVARIEAPSVAVYLHKTNKDLPAQVGVLVGSDAKAKEIARDVAMHMAAYSPLYLTREDVPDDVVANERRVAEEVSRAEGKPEAALPKIIEGRMNGFFKENVLLEQAFAKDPKMTVGDVVDATGGEVTAFARFRVGA